METLRSSKTLRLTDESTQCQNPEQHHQTRKVVPRTLLWKTAKIHNEMTLSCIRRKTKGTEATQKPYKFLKLQSVRGDAPTFESEPNTHLKSLPLPVLVTQILCTILHYSSITLRNRRKLSVKIVSPCPYSNGVHRERKPQAWYGEKHASDCGHYTV
jgi:hypothetical protein